MTMNYERGEMKNRRGAVLVKTVHNGLTELLILCLMGLALLISCTAATTPVPAEPTRVAPGKAANAPASDWQAKWNDVVAEAKRERTLVVATSSGPEVRQPISEAFERKYGITLEFISGRPAELVPRALAERRAGIYSADVWIAGVPLMMTELKPARAIDPLDKLLILPEVTTRENWWGGDLRWVDKEKYMVGLLAYPKAPLFVNTDLVKPDEAKSYKDLLKPEWKGKMVLYDPTISGAGNTWFQGLVKGGIMDLDYMKALARQDLMVQRDARLQVEWVVRGKYPLGLAVRTETAIDFERQGAPAKLMTPAEGTYLIFGGAGLCVVNKAPHPNAATVFVNWLLTKEGSTIFSRAFGAQSARLDVPTEGLHPESVRKQGIDYIFIDTEEYTQEFDRLTRQAIEVFGPLIK